MEEQVILVNSKDKALGTIGKLEAHEKGLLHRAFSVFVFNEKGELLLQKRALHKYHTPGLWTNTCCSHQRPNENNLDAAKRRLKEEMGLNLEPTFSFSFLYESAFENGLIEHEFDHVFYAISNQTPSINPDEVDSYKYLSLKEIEDDFTLHPNQYASWFKICWDEVKEMHKNIFKH